MHKGNFLNVSKTYFFSFLLIMSRKNFNNNNNSNNNHKKLLHILLQLNVFFYIWKNWLLNVSRIATLYQSFKNFKQKVWFLEPTFFWIMIVIHNITFLVNSALDSTFLLILPTKILNIYYWVLNLLCPHKVEADVFILLICKFSSLKHMLRLNTGYVTSCCFLTPKLKL